MLGPTRVLENTYVDHVELGDLAPGGVRFRFQASDHQPQVGDGPVARLQLAPQVLRLAGRERVERRTGGRVVAPLLVVPVVAPVARRRCRLPTGRGE